MTAIQPGGRFIQPTISFCKANPNNLACRCNWDGCDWRDRRPNLAVVEVANFNRRELQRYLRDKNYRPRFYTFGEDQIYFAAGCSHDAQKYDQYSLITKGAKVSFCSGDKVLETVTLTATQASRILARAARHEVTSRTFSNATLKALWDDSMSRRGSGPLRTDGLLYSANAIFATAKYNSNPKLNGQWDLRGGLVAADTGILVSRGLTIYHDNRLRPRLPGGQQAQLRRGIWEVIGR